MRFEIEDKSYENLLKLAFNSGRAYTIKFGPNHILIPLYDAFYIHHTSGNLEFEKFYKSEFNRKFCKMDIHIFVEEYVERIMSFEKCVAGCTE